MQENDKLKLTPEEEQEKAKDERLMEGLRSYNESQGTNRSIVDLFPNIKFTRVSPLESAIVGGRDWQVKVALQRGDDVNERNEDGETPLHQAARRGNLEVARLLVEHGAVIQAKTENGKTALQMAKEKNQTETIEYLKSLE